MKTRTILFIAALLVLQAAATLPAASREENTRSYLRDLGRSDARFQKAFSGIISDRKTGLQWYCGYFWSRKDWHQIDLWARELSVGGGGWRLATMDELATLFPAAKDCRLFSVDWTYSAVITTSSPSAGSAMDPHYREYNIFTRWWLKPGKFPSHYGTSPTAGSLSLLDGSAVPHLCGKPGTGRVRVSIAVRRAPR